MLYNQRLTFNTQTDPRWANEIMTQSPTWTDRLGRWGCVVTSTANILTIFTGESIYPKDMNDIIIDIKGYAYLDDPNTPESKASILLWDNLKNHIESSIKINNRISPDLYKNSESHLYVARVTHSATGGSHYINVLFKHNTGFICFDVEDGIIKYYKKHEIIYLHEFVRL